MSRDQLAKCPTTLSEIVVQIENTEIKIVDLRRERHQLTIVCRVLDEHEISSVYGTVISTFTEHGKISEHDLQAFAYSEIILL